MGVWRLLHKDSTKTGVTQRQGSSLTLHICLKDGCKTPDLLWSDKVNLLIYCPVRSNRICFQLLDNHFRCRNGRYKLLPALSVRSDDLSFSLFALSLVYRVSPEHFARAPHFLPRHFPSIQVQNRLCTLASDQQLTTRQFGCLVVESQHGCATTTLIAAYHQAVRKVCLAVFVVVPIRWYPNQTPRFNSRGSYH